MMQIDATQALSQCSVVFTDLDGSLLDAVDYSYTAAVPALTRLREMGVPVVAATSKTATEVIALYQRLDHECPFIFENGGGIGVPDGYFPHFRGDHREGRYHLRLNGRPYQSIVACLRDLRGRFGWRFMGFADWDVDQVTAHTGLSPDDALAAKERLVSEPLLWADDQAALTEFASHLREQNLHLEQGGRFISVQSAVDKGQAMQQLSTLYADQRGSRVTTIACGDSPNDRGMLMAADLAVIIPGPAGEHLDIPRTEGVYYASAPGPAGWREGIEHFLF